MTNQEKIEWLKTYQESKQAAISLKRQADDYRDTFLHAQVLTGMPRNPSPKRIDESYAKHLEFIERLEGMAEEYRQNFINIENAIENTPNTEYRRLLRLKYIDGYTWEQTAEIMDVLLRQIYRNRDRALDVLNTGI